MTIDLTNVFVSAISGGIVGGFLAVFKTHYKEKLDRKRELISLLISQKHWIIDSRILPTEVPIRKEDYNKAYTAYRSLYSITGSIYRTRLDQAWKRYVGYTSTEKEPFTYWRETDPGYFQYGHHNTTDQLKRIDDFLSFLEDTRMEIEPKII